jgi:hypothetical protein
VGPVVSESLKVREKNRKFNFAMEKLNKWMIYQNFVVVYFTKRFFVLKPFY